MIMNLITLENIYERLEYKTMILLITLTNI